jgi:O-antigen/teichoic acid export membrane protein
MNSTVTTIADAGGPSLEAPPRYRRQGRETTEGGSGIRSNVVWMVTGNFWSGLCQWALLIVLAKLGTVDMVGAFTLGLAIALPVLMFSGLNLRALYVTDCRGTHRFCEYFTLRFLMTIASVVITAAIAVAGGYNHTLVTAIALISLAKGIEYTSDILYGLLQREERMAAMSISLMMRGTLSVCILTGSLYLSGSMIWGAAGLVLASALTLAAFDVPVSLTLLNLRLTDALSKFAVYARALIAGQQGETGRLRSLALAGAPLGLVLMLVSLNVNIPRYFVERTLGIREQGIFSSLANLIAAGSVVIGAIGQCATPRLARSFADGDLRTFRSLLWVLVLTSLGLGATGLAIASTVGRQALTLVYRTEYAARQDILIWLMAASGMIYLGSTMGVALTAARCLRPQLPLFAVAAGSTALACFVLVPIWGLRGAAVSIFVSAIIQCAGGAWLLRKACMDTGIKRITA